MNYDFSKFKNKVDQTEEWFKSEIALLRTGRATPALIENIKVDYYGAKNPVKNMASISVSDARTLVVKPWDTDALSSIEQAISGSELGVQAITEKDIVRIIFPELTEERRKSLLKILNQKLEETKISIRGERDEVWNDIQKKEKEKEISEDDKFRYKDDLQKMVDSANKKFEELSSRKEQEIKV